MPGSKAIRMWPPASRRCARPPARWPKPSKRPIFTRWARRSGGNGPRGGGWPRSSTSPGIELAIASAEKAGAWAGKACGAGGGGCLVILSPAEKTPAVREALSRLREGRLLLVAPENRGSSSSAARLGERLGSQRSFIQAMQRSSSRRIASGDSARYRSPCPGRTHSERVVEEPFHRADGLGPGIPVGVPEGHEVSAAAGPGEVVSTEQISLAVEQDSVAAGWPGVGMATRFSASWTGSIPTIRRSTSRVDAVTSSSWRTRSQPNRFRRRHGRRRRPGASGTSSRRRRAPRARKAAARPRVESRRARCPRMAGPLDQVAPGAEGALRRESAERHVVVDRLGKGARASEAMVLAKSRSKPSGRPRAP